MVPLVECNESRAVTDLVSVFWVGEALQKVCPLTARRRARAGLYGPTTYARGGNGRRALMVSKAELTKRGLLPPADVDVHCEIQQAIGQFGVDTIAGSTLEESEKLRLAYRFLASCATALAAPGYDDAQALGGARLFEGPPGETYRIP